MFGGFYELVEDVISSASDHPCSPLPAPELRAGATEDHTLKKEGNTSGGNKNVSTFLSCPVVLQTWVLGWRRGATAPPLPKQHKGVSARTIGASKAPCSLYLPGKGHLPRSEGLQISVCFCES